MTTIEWGEGLVLRYGGFYGPGTGIILAADAQMAARRARADPQASVPDRRRWGWRLVARAHPRRRIGDRRRARPRSAGYLNVDDDDPAPVREWLPVLASALGAKPPRRVPRWLGRLLAGETATAMMTEARGASNEKAKRELGWQLRDPSWRQGFAQGLG